ncbi:MAG TPA: sugar ABC transporter substrate-binding protein [Acidimicrobiales bacterium]
MKKRKSVGIVALTTALLVPLVGGTIASASSSHSSPITLSGKTKGITLNLMFGSSGTAETKSVNAAAAAWGKLSGNKVNVINASNFTQQLAEGFAGGSPPDVFYLSSSQLETFAKQNDLLGYASRAASASAFYPALVKAYTYNKTWYCVPKDFSNLALEINTTMWNAAGLTKADIPTTWAKLLSDAKKLTNKSAGVVGLDIGNTLDRVGAFFAENGGSYMNKAGTKFTFNSANNVAALKYVQSLAKQGVLAFPPQQSSGWAGEAFGLGKAAMATEGNWIIGSMTSTYPKISWEAVPLPAGPTGIKGTLTFTNCWGIAAQTKYSAAAVNFVKYLSSSAQEMRFADAFGVLPARITTSEAYAKANPSVSAFVQGAKYATSQVGTVGFPTVQAAFDSQVAGLATGSSNPVTMLNNLQSNAQALLHP